MKAGGVKILKVLSQNKSTNLKQAIQQFFDTPPSEVGISGKPHLKIIEHNGTK